MSQDRPKQPHFMNHHQIEKTVASISIEIRNAVATSLNHSRGLNNFPFAFSPNSTSRRMLGSAFCNLTARAGWQFRPRRHLFRCMCDEHESAAYCHQAGLRWLFPRTWILEA